QFGLPGSRTLMLIPSCGNQAASLSNVQPDPKDFDVCHSASRVLTTNQPSSAGARPDPESSSRASGTTRVYRHEGRRPGLDLAANLYGPLRRFYARPTSP